MNPDPFIREDYEKRKVPGTSDRSLFRLKNKFRKHSLLVMYYLTKFDVIQSGFWVIPKITSDYLCKPINNINCSAFNCPFGSGKCGQEGRQKLTKQYLKNEKSISDEIESIFHSFWRVIVWWKNTIALEFRLKNHATWLAESILSHNLRTRILPEKGFVAK